MMYTLVSSRHIQRPRFVAILLLCLSLAVLAGCGKSSVDSGMSTSPPTGGTPSTPSTKPYTVMGQTYYPMASGLGYTEEGIASWYGKDFHGKTTSNGEIYDMYGMTCAHKVLPFGTQLRVTSLENNKSIVVRVNDRGPFVANRIIDLTRTGAEQLDMIGPGTARVRVESIGAIPGQTGTDLSGNFYVQIGSFSIKENAHGLAKTLQTSGKASRVVFVPSLGFHRVQIGPYRTLGAAENASASLHAEYPNNYVVAQ